MYNCDILSDYCTPPSKHPLTPFYFIVLFKSSPYICLTKPQFLIVEFLTLGFLYFQLEKNILKIFICVPLKIGLNVLQESGN